MRGVGGGAIDGVEERRLDGARGLRLRLVVDAGDLLVPRRHDAHLPRRRPGRIDDQTGGVEPAAASAWRSVSAASSRPTRPTRRGVPPRARMLWATLAAPPSRTSSPM